MSGTLVTILSSIAVVAGLLALSLRTADCSEAVRRELQYRRTGTGDFDDAVWFAIGAPTGPVLAAVGGDLILRGRIASGLLVVIGGVTFGYLALGCVLADRLDPQRMRYVLLGIFAAFALLLLAMAVFRVR